MMLPYRIMKVVNQDRQNRVIIQVDHQKVVKKGHSLQIDPRDRLEEEL